MMFLMVEQNPEEVDRKNIIVQKLAAIRRTAQIACKSAMVDRVYH